MKNDKATIGERVAPLLINQDLIEDIHVFDKAGNFIISVPNGPETQKSLQVYAGITNNESMITPEGAKRGLEIYGEELREETRKDPSSHPHIDALEKIAVGEAVRSHVITPYSAKPIPENIRSTMPKIAKEFGTPIHIYDEKGIENTCKEFNSAFSWNNGFTNFYAVKACPNPYLMEIMLKENFGADCSSAPELTLSDKVGMKGERMMFTSNDTPDSEFRYAKEIGAVINLDDITHIEAFRNATGGLPELLCFRYNPGNECEGNSIVGSSEERKYGLTKEQIFEAYKNVKEAGVKRFGLHTMMASNERDINKLVDQAKIMFKLAIEIKEKIGIDLEFINLGGGIGTPYKPEHRAVNLEELGRKIEQEYYNILQDSMSPKIFTECGRNITGPHGWLLTSVRHIMRKHRDYIGVDATMADLMRPGMYGAYHHATVVGKEKIEHNKIYDLVGSLCENCDKFAVQRFLPEIEKGDLIAIHNAGAHGRAMCFNYNAKLRSGEVLVKKNGQIELIRRPETEKDYFATLDFEGSRYTKLAK